MVIFTVECFSAIIAKGLWQHDEAYLKVSVFLIQETTVFMICHQSEHLEFSWLHHRDDWLHRYLPINNAGNVIDPRHQWCQIINFCSWKVLMQKPFAPSGFSGHCGLCLGCPACRFYWLGRRKRSFLLWRLCWTQSWWRSFPLSRSPSSSSLSSSSTPSSALSSSPGSSTKPAMTTKHVQTL